MTTLIALSTAHQELKPMRHITKDSRLTKAQRVTLGKLVDHHIKRSYARVYGEYRKQSFSMKLFDIEGKPVSSESMEALSAALAARGFHAFIARTSSWAKTPGLRITVHAVNE